MPSETASQKAKIEFIQSSLEKLKQDVATVEAKYRILDGHYSVICDEALTKINDARSTIQDDEEPTDNKSEESGVIEPCLNEDPENGSSLEDVYNYYCYNLSLNQSPGPCHQPKTPVIDHMANAIETGLDKLGDALVYPFDIIARLHKKIMQRKDSGDNTNSKDYVDIV
jgi:hypothetical protein